MAATSSKTGAPAANGGSSGSVNGSNGSGNSSGGGGGGKRSAEGKQKGAKEQKRRKVSLACVYCRRSHMTCDDSRPCKRCIKRDIGHLCHDRPPGNDGPKAAQPSASPASGGAAAASIPRPSAPLYAPVPAGPQELLKLSQAQADAQAQAAGGGATSRGAQPGANGSAMLPGIDAASALPQIPVAGGVGQGQAQAAGPNANAGPSQSPFGNLTLGPLTFSMGAAPLAPGAGAPSGSFGSMNATGWPSSFRSGLGGASWLGLGGGPASLDGDGTVTQGDSAGGNEFNILSEFLESLDGAGGLLSPNIGPSSAAGAAGAQNAGASNAPSPALLPAAAGDASAMPAEGKDAPQAEGSAAARLPPVSGAEAAADVLSNYSTIQEAEKSDANKDAQGGKAHKRQQGSIDAPAAGGTASVAATPAGGLVSTLPNASGPNFNWTSKTERFFLTAADQKDGTRDERLGKVIQAKYEAGLLRPYNHVNGYARLNRWMERNVSPASRRRILKPLSVFRPAFRAVAQSLTNIDLIYIEEAFERLLLDYDRVFSTQGIPACLWRRTGEIYKGNKEFAELVGVQIDALREGRLCIYELMAEESAVNYWEKYGAVSFDPGQKAVLTTCVLKTRNPPRQQKSIPAALAVAAQLPRSTAGSNNGDSTPVTAAAMAQGGSAMGPTSSQGQATVAAVAAATAAAASADGGDGTAKKAPSDAGGSLVKSSAVAAEPKRDAAGFVEIKCCFSFTIRRDQWNIPTMIVGNFLPINTS